jgi:Na+/melibiose symporter-like transporter
MISFREKSYDALPALAVRRGHLRHALRTVTTAWMFGIVWMACISGSQVQVFGRLLGFTDFDFGVFAAIPFAAAFAQLIASSIIERTGLRKYQFIVFGAIHRILWVAMAAVPLLLPPGRSAVVLFLSIFALSNVLAHISTPPWWNWMGDLIPRRIRGRYFANRARWTLPINVLTVLATGAAVDFVSRPGPDGVVNTGAVLAVICGIFAIAGVFGATDILLFLRLREIVVSPLTRQPEARRPGAAGAVVDAVLEPFRLIVESFHNRVFRHYALFGATLMFGLALGNQYFWLYTLEDLHYTKLGANIVFIVCGSLAALLMVRVWGKLIDRWGRRPVLIIGALGVVLGPTGWFVIPAGNVLAGYLLGAATCVYASVTWGAIDMGQTNVMLGFSESAGRTRFMAAATVVTSIGGFLGGLTGGKIAQSLAYMQHAPLHVGPFEWNNYHIVFLASAALRLASVGWLIGMPDPGSKRLRHLAREIWSGTLGAATTRLLGIAGVGGGRRDDKGKKN